MVDRSRRRCQAVFVILTLTLSAATGGTVQDILAATRNQDVVVLDTDPNIARQQVFRDYQGFRADDTYVRQLSQQYGYSQPDQPWGQYLTVNELLGMRLRVQLSAAVSDSSVSQYTNSIGTDFAGVYLDSRRLRAVFMFTANESAHSSEIAAIFSMPTYLESTLVTYSQATLSATELQVMADTAGLEAAGAPLTGVYVDVPNDRLVVVVSGSSQLSDVAIGARYGSPPYLVVVHQERAHYTDLAANSTTSRAAPAFAGGAYITDPTSGLACTSGFVAKSSLSYYLLTAGHCSTSTTGHQVMQGNSIQQITVGTVDYNEYSGNFDAERIPYSSIYYAGNRTIRSFDSSKFAHYLAILSSQAQNSDHVGDAVCAFGYGHTNSYGFSGAEYCGNIVSKPGSWCYDDGHCILWPRLFNSPSVNGDSGGPVYNSSSNEALGIISGSDVAGNAIYQHIYDVLVNMPGSVSLYVSSPVSSGELDSGTLYFNVPGLTGSTSNISPSWTWFPTRTYNWTANLCGPYGCATPMVWSGIALGEGSYYSGTWVSSLGGGNYDWQANLCNATDSTCAVQDRHIFLGNGDYTAYSSVT